MTRAKLLVVDDEESVAVTMGAILELDGYQVATATSGARAIELVRESTFDVVLTDLRLDDMDGLTIVGELSRLQPETVSIILTGYASLESAIKALREGAYDYLIKPCDVDELRAVVARGVERRQLGAQLKARLQELEEANQLIHSLNRDLQRRVEEATAELQQRMIDLARANEEIANLYRGAQQHVEQLEELDRLKSRFLSMASHELKTPLTSISGLSQVLLRRVQRRLQAGAPSPEEWEAEQRGQLERLEMLNSQSARLGRIIDELLDVSRIESGKLEFHMEQIDLGQLTRQVVERTHLAAPNQHLRLEHSAERGLPVLADRDHLEQVLDNLLSNALKYSPESGDICVTVREQNGNAVLSVRDSGPGIPVGQHEAVFGLFYQAEDPISRRTGGMGLGLYISREIVVRHGGRIWVESEPGHGSTFYVSLPKSRLASLAVK
ncbi:MAG TPA: ATP-binding protein [Chloroflexota bacterium]|nr:ATP-binding protein [Chloroflexota bacterium]